MLIHLKNSLTFLLGSTSWILGDSSIPLEALDDSSDLIDSLSPDSIKEVSFWGEFIHMMIILGIILGVVLIIAWLLKGVLNKRVHQINESSGIKILERRQLSQKSAIYLVEIYNRQFLVGDSVSSGVQYLSECTSDTPLPQQPPTEKASKFSFTELLQRKISNSNTKMTSEND